MIYDSLAHMESYKSVHPNVYRGLKLLRDTDFSALEDGRHEVDGDNLFFLLQSYETNPTNDTPEAHRKYIDIQYLLSGQEQIGVAPLEEMSEEAEARPEGDIWFYHGATTCLPLMGDRFLALWPGDAHAPNIALAAPTACRKCVVKVKV